MPQKFKVATAAGTFDHFHKGHEMFLRTAFTLVETVYVAITSNQYVKSARNIPNIEPFEKRKETVEAFLHKERLLTRANIFELHDICGPTLEPDCPIEAVVVTKKTLYGANLINTLRAKKGLSPLDILTVSYLKAEDDGDLSSTRIRNGEIDREGKPWIKKEWLKKTLTLPDTLRPSLQKPIGELIRGNEQDLNEAVAVIKQTIHTKDGTLIVTVGDVVAQSFNAGQLLMDMAIVDYQIKRVATFKNLAEIGFKKKEPHATAENPKGTLTADLFKVVNNAMGKVRNNPPYVIRVIGEEDLATLAVVLAAPLDTHVFYGQPPYHSLQGKANEGVVEVIVTEEKKADVREIVTTFTS